MHSITKGCPSQCGFGNKVQSTRKGYRLALNLLISGTIKIIKCSHLICDGGECNFILIINLDSHHSID